MRWLLTVGSVCLMLAAVAPAADAQLRPQIVVQGLSNPVAFVQDPTSNSRFFIVQQGGLIRVLDNGQVLQTPLLDLTTAIKSGGEQGLLGMAFPPNAATTGRFFVYFTKTRPGDSGGNDLVIARFRRSSPTAATADVASRFDLIWSNNLPFIPHPSNSNHNGGNLVFGPDGYLYIGTGDGGSGNDPPNNAQNPMSLLGKMLRIDVNVADSHPTGYTIPPGNPFIGTPAFPEIWAFGLRNPWRYGFDDVGAGATAALIIGDVGQGAREEVDYEPAGAGGRNYGWSIREGTIATPGVTGRTPAYLPLTNPLLDYPRTIGRSDHRRLHVSRHAAAAGLSRALLRRRLGLRSRCLCRHRSQSGDAGSGRHRCSGSQRGARRDGRKHRVVRPRSRRRTLPGDVRGPRVQDHQRRRAGRADSPTRVDRWTRGHVVVDAAFDRADADRIPARGRLVARRREPGNARHGCDSVDHRAGRRRRDVLRAGPR